MHSPRFAQQELKSNAAAIPEKCGIPIPKSSKELLRKIKELMCDINFNISGNGLDQLRKQEALREASEMKLMEFEDDLFLNFKLSLERVDMETEDELSFKLREKFRKPIDLKERVRLDMEARKKREAEEKGKKRKEAEERRAKVVERLRQQQILEEERRKEAEALRQHIEEEAKRKEQEEIDRQLQEAALLQFEDEMSRIAEIEYREHLEKLNRKKEEEEKLRQFEKEQQEKDELEKEKRKERMAALAEKKKKLAALQNGKPGEDKSMADAREEAAKLGKQMRIQHMAKTATRQQYSKDTAAPSIGDNLSRDAVKTMKKTASFANVKIGGDKTERASIPNNALEDISDNAFSSKEVLEFKTEIEGATSAEKLRSLMKETSAEKRGVKLEYKQRQTLLHQGNDAALGLEENSEAPLQQLANRLAVLTAKEQILTERLQKIVGTSNAHNATTVLGSSNNSNLNGESMNGVIGGQLPPGTSDMPDGNGNSKEALFKQAEVFMREGTELLGWLKQRRMGGVQKDESGGGVPPSASVSASSSTSTPRVATNQYHRIAMLQLEISKLVKSIDNQGIDPIKYAEKLAVLAADLKATTASFSSSSNNGHTSTSLLPMNEETMNQKREGSLVLEQPTLSSPPKEDLALSSIKQQPQHNIQRLELDAISSKNNGSGNDSTSDDLPSAIEELLRSLMGWDECLHSSMATAAHHAAFYGHLEVLQYLTKLFDCFIMDDSGRTPLFYAAVQNQLECVAHLVSLDPLWLDVGDEEGDTCLHAAAGSDGIEVLHFLLSCEAHPDTANHTGITASHMARSWEALNALYQANAQLFCIDSKSRLPLWYASSEGRVDCVDFLCRVTPTQYIMWPDEEGETCLHKASSNGHSKCLEIMCYYLESVDDLCALNRKHYTAAHLAKNAEVLKVLYENGSNMWLADPKGRMPLFVASFYGRTDCVAFLIDIAASISSLSLSESESSHKSGGGGPKGPKQKQKQGMLYLTNKDVQGDTALHAACLCGHLQCALLLLFFISGEENKGKLLPFQLANKAGHAQIAQVVAYIENLKSQDFESEVVFGGSFDNYSAVVIYYGARWTKQYDTSYDAVYYIDKMTGGTQWERPESYDESPAVEGRDDKAREILKQFYLTYNPEKITEINPIMQIFKPKGYTDLFIKLAEKYQLEDLSMFQDFV